MSKNKYGFTLIELLVVIVIMTSILILGIINFNNLSKKNKEKAWEKVKEQVELASKDYYDTYSYKLGNLDNQSLYARVSVKTLVENDFINIVTDPRSGKKVNYCDYVEVKKNDKKYEYKYHENNDNSKCDIQEIIEIKEFGAPSINLKMSDEATGNDNYYIEDVDVIATVSLDDNNIPIDDIKYKFNDGDYKYLDVNDKNEYQVSAIDGNSVTASFVVKNILGKFSSATITYKKDTVKPTVDLVAKQDTIKNIETYSSKLSKDELSKMQDYKSGTWINQGIYFSVDFNDEISGLDGSKTYCTDSRPDSKNFTNYRRAVKTSDFIIECSAVDKAGNKSEKVSYMAKIDLVKPTCSIAFKGKEGWNGWFVTEDVSSSLTKTDKNSGIKEFGLSLSKNKTYNSKSKETQTLETSGTTWYGYVKDLAGNENDCSSIVKLEKEVTISFDKTNTNESKSTKSHEGKIFNKNYSGTCGYGECSDIKCIGTNDERVSKDYFARACMDVYSYPRYFYVSSVSTGSNKSVKVTDLVDKDYNNTNTPGMKRTTTLSRFDCKNDWGSDYKYNKCGGESGNKNDFSAHVYKYVSESGLQSNAIRLYTEYSVDCKY